MLEGAAARQTISGNSDYAAFSRAISVSNANRS